MKLNIPNLVYETVRALKNKGFEGHIVGGAIRDILSQVPTYDWDFTTNARPEQIQEIFPESFYDNNFGTVGITAENLVKQFNLINFDYKGNNLNPNDVLEITTFRSEQGYADRRHPDKVIWGKTLQEDLQRRDFTINALALDLKDNNFELVDLFNGRQDLENKLIRTVGSANQRFSEDALRMMRAIRLATQLGFIIEEKTLKAIKRDSSLLNYVSKERIREELIKIIKSNFPAQGIKLLYNSDLLEYVIPELIKTRDVEQAGHHTKDVWNHSLDSLAECPSKNPIVRFATLLHDIGKPISQRNINGKITFYGHEVISAKIAKNIARRLKFSKKDIDKIWILVRYHMFAYDSHMTDKAIKRFIRRVGRENINDMMMLRIGDRKGGGSKATSWRLRELQERIGKLLYDPLQVKDLKINGNDVMKVLEIKPGPKVGKILNSLFEEVLEEPSKNNEEYLLKRVKEINALPS